VQRGNEGRPRESKTDSMLANAFILAKYDVNYKYTVIRNADDAKTCTAMRKYSISKTNVVMKGQRSITLCGPNTNHYKEVAGGCKRELYPKLLS
jgi:hypothetical protein